MTKNKEKKRNPDAHSVKKGNTWRFGYKAHVGADKDTGLIHHVEITSANIHDVTMVPQLLSGEETAVYGDTGYLGAEKRMPSGKTSKASEFATRPTADHLKARTVPPVPARKSSAANTRNHLYTPRWGLPSLWPRDCFVLRKAQYRSLRKQTEKLNMMFTLANLYLADKRGLLT